VELPLAVRGLKRPVCRLQGGDLPLGGLALSLAEHRLPGGIPGDHELVGAALLGDDELTLESAISSLMTTKSRPLTTRNIAMRLAS
jgi:hypothetical protein